MTKAQLREAVKREARIKSGANLDTLVDEIIADILTDYCNLAQPNELLKEGIAITLVDEQQSYSLPDDYANLAVVRYGRGPDPTTYRVIKTQTATVAQTWSDGIPRFYRLVAGPKLSFWPYGRVVVADSLLIDYYINPLSVFDADDDDFPVPRLESTVKKEAIARVQRFHSSGEEANMTKGDALSSFNSFNASQQ